MQAGDAEAEPFRLGKDTFVSPFLVVLVAETGGRWHKRWYFARDNCSETQFRQLCRLLLMTARENPAG